MIRRWAFNMVAGVSLSLCLATAALWLRGQWAADGLYFYGDSRSVSLLSADGMLLFSTWQLDFRDVPPQTLSHRVYPPGQIRAELPGDEPWAVRIAGTWWIRRPQMIQSNPGPRVVACVQQSYIRTLILPEPQLVLVLLFAPAWWILRWRATPRHFVASCRKCFDNLTGNTSGTCPECGTRVPSKPEIIA